MRSTQRLYLSLCAMAVMSLAINSAQAVSVSADYRADFNTPAPSAGWSYQWNDGGAVGTATNYTDMVFDAANNRYDADGIPGLPGANPGAFVFLGGTGGHPGRGAGDGGSGGIDRAAIPGYTIQAGEQGQSYLAIGANKSAGGGQDGLDVRVFVNDTLVTQQLNRRQTAFTVDLGNLKVGDTVYAAVGPNNRDGSDGFNFDMNLVNFKGAAVAADYTDDFAFAGPAAGWEYVWNENGPVGDDANYSPLLPSGTQYDQNGIAGLPDAEPGAFVSLNAQSGHPGRGAGDAPGDGIDHAAIAGFTVGISGSYDILAALSRRIVGGTIDVDVFRNNDLLLSLNGIANSNTFSTSLGNLNKGDTIYFALGPNGADGSDGTNFDFTLFVTVPEPGSALLLSLGGLAFLRRRRIA